MQFFPLHFLIHCLLSSPEILIEKLNIALFMIDINVFNVSIIPNAYKQANA